MREEAGKVKRKLLKKKLRKKKESERKRGKKNESEGGKKVCVGSELCRYQR